MSSVIQCPLSRKNRAHKETRIIKVKRIRKKCFLDIEHAVISAGYVDLTEIIIIIKVNWIRKLNATKFLQHNRFHQYANFKFSYSNKIPFYRPKIIFSKDDRNFYSPTDWLVPINAIILLNALKTEDHVIFKLVVRHDYSICPLFTRKQRCLLKGSRKCFQYG